MDFFQFQIRLGDGHGMGDTWFLRHLEFEAVAFATTLDDEIHFRAAVGAPEERLVRFDPRRRAELFQREAFP
jgi:hypothetical protein